MLRRNIEHFLKKKKQKKKHIYEKLGVSEMNFFLFPTVCIFYFRKNMDPRPYILFLVDKSVT